jgi:hypothetical protein
MVRNMTEKLSEWVKKNIPDRLIMTPTDYRKLLGGIEALEAEVKTLKDKQQFIHEILSAKEKDILYTVEKYKGRAEDAEVRLVKAQEWLLLNHHLQIFDKDWKVLEEALGRP